MTAFESCNDVIVVVIELLISKLGSAEVVRMGKVSTKVACMCLLFVVY